MNTWAPLWSKVVDSSIWMEDKNTRILFVTMLALKDRDHVVRHGAFELSRKANLTEAEVLESLKILQSPDTKRLEPQEFEGRRIEKVEGGWFMLNGEKYRKAMQDLYRKEYKRIKQAEYRIKDEKTDPSDPTTEDAHTLLELMNQLSGGKLRPVASSLEPIQRRLKEDGVDLDGCAKMLRRQWELWKDNFTSDGRAMREYFKPSTIFKTAKFNEYYAARDLPITKPVLKLPNPEPNQIQEHISVRKL